MRKVLVSPRSLTRDGHPALSKLEDEGYELVFATPGKQPSQEELLEKLPGCIGYLAGVEPIAANVLEAAKGLRIISRNGVGVDNIDLDTCEKLGIAICRTGGANAKGVAELTIALLLSLVRGIPFADRRMKARAWERKKGIELEGRTIGLVGCGQIGKETAVRAIGLGMRACAFRRNPDRAFAPSGGFAWVSFDDLIERSEVVSIHRPANRNGEPAITADVIARMKRGVYVINTSRASLIDEDAALRALEEGRISGLATDVYHTEPPDNYKLVDHERVIATPHLGGYTIESVDRATLSAVENIINTLK